MREYIVPKIFDSGIIHSRKEVLNFMYSDENKSSALARYLNTFDYVIIDTCSLMDDGFPLWMDVLRNAKTYRKKELEILVPRRCYDELKKHARQKENDSKRIDAKRGLKILRHARWTHLLTLTKKDKNENFADNVIYVKVSVDRLFSKILIITQDKKLATDLRALNQLKSQSGRPIEVCKIAEGGRLLPNKGETFTPKEHKTSGKDNSTPAAKSQNKAPSEVDAILLADSRLSAVISNATYPAEKKRADAKAQIKALEKLPDSKKAQLSLLVPMAKLQELANGGKQLPALPSKQKETVSAVKKEAEAPKKEPKTQTPAKEKLWYGVGKTIHEGFAQCAAHYGMVFHEPTVTYFQQAHGPLDLTTKDLEAIEAQSLPLLKGEEKSSFNYRDMALAVQKVGANYRCWIDVNHLPAALAAVKEEKVEKKAEAPKEKKTEAPKKAEKKAEAPKKVDAPKKAKPEPKPVEVVAMEEKPAEQPAPEPKAEAVKPAKTKSVKKKQPKPEESKSEETKPEEPKAEEKAPEPKPTKKKAKKAEAPVKLEEAPAEPAPEPKPKAKKSTKTKKETAEAEKVEEKPAEKAEKPQQKPAQTKKTKAKKAAEDKPAEPESQPKPKADPLLQKAAAADRRLNSVLPNPTYPLAEKVADLKAQRELLEQLTPEQIQTLKYGPKQIEEWLQANANS